MKIYDIAIVGAGAAGLMAAAQASKYTKQIIVFEKNNTPGMKILVSGKGRCNITNSASLDVFLEKFDKTGKFLRSAFTIFSNRDLMEFFQSRGLALKTERQGRVFPKTDKSSSVLDVLMSCLDKKHIKIVYNACVDNISHDNNLFSINVKGKYTALAKKLILTTGGASYRATGSDGRGIKIAGNLGHETTDILPALVPLKTKEHWVKRVQGLTLKNIRITFKYKKKKIVSNIGELVFTHFGVSGPLVLDLSADIVRLIKDHGSIDLFIDLKPGLTHEKLNARLQRDFSGHGKLQIKNLMKDMLPQKLIDIVLILAAINPAGRANQITRKQRAMLLKILKALPLTITDSLGFSHAMVTQGGVSTKQINSKTMESRLINGLYFAGEIIDGCAKTGGYNLQQAFSTGYVAGRAASGEKID